MVPAKTILVRTLIPAFLGLLLTSCASFDMFKGGSGGDGPSTAAEDQARSGSAKAPDPGLETLQNKIEMLEDKVSTLETQVSGQKKVVYSMEYTDPAQLYKKARTLLLEKDPDSAADLFATFARQHPEHALADNALYWLGECHYTRGQYEKAVHVFDTLVKTYPKAEKVPDALLKTGFAYLSLDDTVQATHFLKLVIKKYPFSPAAEKAEQKLSTFD